MPWLGREISHGNPEIYKYNITIKKGSCTFQFCVSGECACTNDGQKVFPTPRSSQRLDRFVPCHVPVIARADWYWVLSTFSINEYSVTPKLILLFKAGM